MKSFDIRYIDPISNREVLELEVPANQLIDRDGETWYDYDGDYGQELRRFVEVITATQCDTTAKASYMVRFGTASE
jgi:hypothetical protein